MTDDGVALQELAHILAHRLRGLVAGIEGYADLLTDTLETREQRECTLRIVEGTVRIERVLAELQVFSQPVALACVPLTGEEVITGALSVLEEHDAARVEVADAPAMALHADPRLLRQALLILLQNALEASKGPIRLALTAGDDEVCFAVWNEGVIAVEDAQRRVFVPFYTTKAQNMGVGLAMARRIAVAHAGTLVLAGNDPVDGVCFRLCLPAPARDVSLQPLRTYYSV